MEAKKNEERDEASGQYVESLDHVCRLCGLRKGQHDAVKPFASEFGCPGFKKTKKA